MHATQSSIYIVEGISRPTICPAPFHIPLFIFASLLICSCLHLIVTHQKTLIISHSGSDASNCGVKPPCRTILYTLSKQARSNDVIKLDNQNAMISQPYVPGARVPLLENITLTGINGQPTIRGGNSIFDNHLFDSEVITSSVSFRIITIHIKNIRFERIGIVRVEKKTAILVIKIVSCTVSQLMYCNTLSVIESSATRTNVLIKNSLLLNVSKGVCLNSNHVEFKIDSSEVLYEGEIDSSTSQCSQLIIAGQYLSLVAHFIESKFKRIILINLKSTEQGVSAISIIGSAFDDERISPSHFRCSSRIALSNTEALIADTRFSNIESGNFLIKMSSSYVVFKKCVFRNIRSYSSFLSGYSNTVVAFYRCQFQNNEVFTNCGSILLIRSQGLFQNCNFRKNVANGRYGGAICSVRSVLNLTQCVFQWNKAPISGGALLSHRTSNVHISQCMFKENHAIHSGGAIWHLGTKLFINSTTFVKNSANKDGGAIFLMKQSNAFILGCVFKRNLAIVAGGAIIHFGNKLFVRNTKFQANVAKGSRASSGGALYIAGNSIIKLSSCYLKSNMATVNGGGIAFCGNILSIVVNTTFDHNLAVSSSLGTGGAVRVCARSRIRIFDCRFKLNVGTLAGGAILVFRGSTLYVSNSTFEHNDAGRYGGALSSYQPAKIDISCCSFKINKATLGGAIFHFGNKLTISNTTFYYNAAVKSNLSYGGALHIQTRCSVYIRWCGFKRNEAAKAGGAISYFGNKLEISNTAFQHNGAVRGVGGALFTSGSSDVNISHSCFKGNKAVVAGGAITGHYGNKLEILDTIFVSNIVKSNGGALFTYKQSIVKVCDCRFEGNKAASVGGAISHSENKLDIVNTTFQNSSARFTGGALDADPGSHVVIRYTSFKCNKGGFSGGAISVIKNTQSLSNMTAEGNYGQHSKVTPDGMAQAESRPLVSLLFCHLEGNTAYWSGGAISYYGRHLYIRNTTFVHNVVSISGDGGALDTNSISVVEICNSIFRGNMATRAGGTISHMGGGNQYQ